MSFLNTLYFSEHLQEKMEKILQCPATVVEGPAGYGKTTAVSQALKRISEEQIFWLTAVKGATSTNYTRMCNLIRAIDSETAKSIDEKGIPNAGNSEEIKELIRGIKTEKESFLVLDNLQFFQYDLEPGFFQAFLQHTCERLHVVLITQYLNVLREVVVRNPYVNTIFKEDLILRKKEIITYCDSLKIAIDDSMAALIFQKYEGWIIAVSMILKERMDTGEWSLDMDLNDIFYHLVWARLSETEQEQLIPMTFFAEISMQNLEDILQVGRMKTKLRALYNHIPMLRYDPVQKKYRVHSVLREFLRKQMGTLSREKRIAIGTRAGELHAKMDEQTKAITCFYYVSNYEAILKCNLTNQGFVKIDTKNFHVIAEEIFEECDMKIKKRYPIALLILAYIIFCAGDRRFFEEAMEEIKEIVWETGDLQLKGEWYLMTAFLFFPNLDQMEKRFGAAKELMKWPSEVFVKEEPFAFGCPSMLFLFYMNPGKAEATAEKLERALKVYGEVTDGHGIGADILFRGELASIQCHYDQAEIYAYQAGNIAIERKEITLIYGVALLLGRIAIGRGDEQGLKDALSYMEINTQIGDTLLPQSKEANRCMQEIVRCRLSSIKEDAQAMSMWSRKDIYKQYGKNQAVRILQHTYINEMILKGEFSKAMGNIKAALSDTRNCNLIQKYYMYIGSCFCSVGLGRPKEAVQWIEKAIQIAKPDDLEAAFVHYRYHLSGLLNQPEILEKHKDFISSIMKKKEVFQNSDKVIYEKLPLDQSLQSLTVREKEVAKLVALGLRNKEIADRLCISEWTVKNHLRAIYSKLNIDRRSQVSEFIHE